MENDLFGLKEPGGTPTKNYQQYPPPPGVRETELRIKDRTQDPGWDFRIKVTKILVRKLKLTP